VKQKTWSLIATGLCIAGLQWAATVLADVPRAPGIFAGIPPTTGPAIVDGQLTEQQMRDKAAALWNQQEENGSGLPHALWVDRKGIVVASPPTTAPADPLASATMVSIHLDNVPTRKAISDFSKQTGVKLAMIQPQMWRGRSFPAVKMDADNIPLLEAVNEFACKTGLAPAETRNWGMAPPSDPAHPHLAMTIQEENRSLGPWEVSGPFAFEVQQISRSILLSQDAGNSPVMMFIAVQHEPRITVLGKDQSVTVTEAVDDKGNKLSAAGYGPMPGRHRGLWGSLLFGSPKTEPVYWATMDQPYWVNLQCPPDAGKKIVRFRGTVGFLVQTESQTLEAKAEQDSVLEKTVGGVKCKVGPIKLDQGQQLDCPLLFTRETMDQASWTQMASALRGIVPRLLDDNGVVLPNEQPMGGNSQGDSVSASFHWWMNGTNGDAPRPAKLLLDLPTRTRVIEVPIQFDNLPLP
jgi:hypothetical protein